MNCKSFKVKKNGNEINYNIGVLKLLQHFLLEIWDPFLFTYLHLQKKLQFWINLFNILIIFFVGGGQNFLSLIGAFSVWDYSDS